MVVNCGPISDTFGQFGDQMWPKRTRLVKYCDSKTPMRGIGVLFKAAQCYDYTSKTIHWGVIALDFLEILSGRLPEIGVAAGVAILGSMWSTVWVKRRVRHSIGSEIIAIQSAMYKRAEPEVWRISAERDRWMLEPYLRHINLLRDMASNEGLKSEVRDGITSYHEAADTFIDAWSVAQRRGVNQFWAPYNTMLAAAENVLVLVGRQKAHAQKVQTLRSGKQTADD
jgi:hypothetical protein